MNQSNGQNLTGAGRVFRLLLPYLVTWQTAAEKRRLSLIFLLMVLERGFIIGSPFILKYFFDDLSERVDFPPLVVTVPLLFLLSYAVFEILETLVSEINPLILFPFVQGAERTIAERAFRHIHSLSLRYHLDRKTGTLTKALDRAIKAIVELVSNLFWIVPVIFEALIVALILGLGFSVWLGLCLMSLLGLFIAYTYLLTRARNKIRFDSVTADNLAGARAVDSLLNYETVKYFGNEEAEAQRFLSAFGHFQKANFKLNSTLATLNIGQRLIMALGLAVAMMIVVMGIADQTMTLGDMVLVQGLFFNLYRPLFFLGTIYRNVTQALVDLNVLFDIIGEPEEIRDSKAARPLEVSQGRVAFEGVSFFYNKERQILDNVSFEITGGRKTAVVGGSGAGKSTLARLLFRFYDCQQGTIMIDGQSVKDVTQDSLREVIGMVPQDTVLFNETIGYNIAYGRLSASQEEIEEAARGAQIHAFIEALPEGYNTLVGERGLKLSGGEKQRVAIARCLLKNPPLLILDEATSALDSHTEAEIQTALARASEGRTTMVIAHRLSTVVDADEIIVMEAGRIVERGRHGALLKAKGVYASLWQRQAREQALLDDLKSVTEVS